MSVTATLKFLASREAPATYVASSAGGEDGAHEGDYVFEQVEVHDGRAAKGPFELDRAGFRLVSHETAVSDFYDDAQIADPYEAEVKAVVQAATGARAVEIFDHTRRAAAADVRQSHGIREPASIVHNDYTARSGVKRLKDFYADDPGKAEELLERRFAIVNLWRSIGGTVENNPMVFCDATTIAPDDLVSVTRQAKDRIGELQLAVHGDDQRWYYFPRMTMDEALLIKTFDSAEDGRTRFTLHSSFDDPTAPADAPPRQSIETRCFVFY